MSKVNNQPRSYHVIGVVVSLMVLAVALVSLYLFWRGEGRHLDSQETASHLEEGGKAPHTDEEEEGIHLSEEAKRNIGLATEMVGK